MRTLTAVLLCALTSGCMAHTDVTTMTRPDWRPRAFHRIVVYYGSADLDRRKQVEDRFASEDSAFVQSYKVFFVGEKQTAEEVETVMKEQGADAALILNPESAGSSSATVPGQTTTTCTLVQNGQCQQATTTGGPMTFHYPHANYGAILIDWKTRTTVWAATAKSGGNGFAGQGNLRKSFVDTIIKKLRTDGLLSRPR